MLFILQTQNNTTQQANYYFVFFIFNTPLRHHLIRNLPTIFRANWT